MKENRLKILRAEYNLTQREVAEVLGVTRKTYYLFEKDVSIVKSKYIEKLADYYNVSTDYIYARTDSKKTIQKD